MNAHQRKVKAKAFIAELKACSDDEKVSALLEAADDLMKLAKEIISLRTTITEQQARTKELEDALRFAKPLLKTARNNLAPNRICLEHDDEDELAYWDQLSKVIELIGE